MNNMSSWIALRDTSNGKVEGELQLSYSVWAPLQISPGDSLLVVDSSDPTLLAGWGLVSAVTQDERIVIGDDEEAQTPPYNTYYWVRMRVACKETYDPPLRLPELSTATALPRYASDEYDNVYGGILEAQDSVAPPHRLFGPADPPGELVEVVDLVAARLIAHLQQHPHKLDVIRPHQFEELIAEILAGYGWSVQLTPPTRDGGYDILAISKDGAGVRTSWIIECKKYRLDRKVGIDIARSLYAVKGEVRAANAMLATTSHFTKGVKDFKASRYDFELKDYEAILEWINEYQPNPNGKLYIRNNRLIVPGEDE